MNKKRRVGKRYQAEIPEYKGTEFCKEDNYKGVDMLVWSPYNKISDNDLKEYLTAATLVFNLKEDEALCYLCFYNFDLRKAYSQMKAIYVRRYNVLTKDKAHFERFVFTEHKLDTVKSIFDGSIIDQLFMYYYTKQTFHSKSFLDCLVFHNEENTPVFQYLINYSEYSKLDLKDDYIFYGQILERIIKTIVQNKLNPNFEITNMPLLKNIRLEIEKNIRRIQRHKQMIFEKVCILRAYKSDFFDYQKRIKQAQSNSKWNRLEIILLVECLRLYKNDYAKIANVLRTKREEQVREFYSRHCVFLRTLLQVNDSRTKHQLIKQYLQRPLIRKEAGLNPTLPIPTTSRLMESPSTLQETISISESS